MNPHEHILGAWGFVLLGGVVLLLAAAVYGAIKTAQRQNRLQLGRKRQEHKRSVEDHAARLSQLLNRVQAGDPEAEAELLRDKKEHDEFVNYEVAYQEPLAVDYQQVLKDIPRRKWLREYEGRFQRHLERYQTAGTLSDQVDRLALLLNCVQEARASHREQTSAIGDIAAQHEFDEAEARVQLADLVQQLYDQLVLLAPVSKPAWTELDRLIKGFSKYGAIIPNAPTLDYPTDWPLWTVKWCANPTLADFAVLPPADSLSPGEIDRRTTAVLQAENRGSGREHLSQLQMEASRLLAYATADRSLITDDQYSMLHELLARVDQQLDATR